MRSVTHTPDTATANTRRYIPVLPGIPGAAGVHRANPGQPHRGATRRCGHRLGRLLRGRTTARAGRRHPRHRSQSWDDGPARVETLGSLGSYQVASRAAGSDRLIVGVSLNLADQIISRKNITTTVLVATALVITAVLTAWVVGYALRPLRRLAATAAEVAALPLAGEDHRSACGSDLKTPTRTTKSGSWATP